MKRSAVLLALIGATFISQPVQAQRLKFQSPPTLSFQDLIALADRNPASAAVEAKLNRLLSEPVIDNGASLRGAKPHPVERIGIGPVLRIAQWNINRGINFDYIRFALADAPELLRRARYSSRKKRAVLQNELQDLQRADVIILDEVDWGMKRSGYRNVARELAQALHMNYVYGVEFIELERIYLGLRKLDQFDIPRQRATGETFGVDPKRYLGLEGSALLSRYPIRDASILRLPQAYDWYQGEIQHISDLERIRRWSAEKLFDEQVKRQVRRGGRMAMVIDLEVPESPTGILTVICPHLENYCPPDGRRKQMDYILRRIGTFTNPLVMAGDLNSTGHNAEPTSIKQIILEHLTDYRFWIRELILRLNPVGVYNYLLYPINYFKNYHDPTALDFYFLLPNREKPLFNDVHDFHFEDGTVFDFAGNSARSFKHKGRTLSDSSQRAWKGYSTTFAFNRPLFHLVGHYKLDWFFVKPAAADHARSAFNQRFHPYFGRALREVDEAVEGRISDHYPITVDLPLTSGAP